MIIKYWHDFLNGWVYVDHAEHVSFSPGFVLAEYVENGDEPSEQLALRKHRSAGEVDRLREYQKDSDDWFDAMYDRKSDYITESGGVNDWISDFNMDDGPVPCDVLQYQRDGKDFSLIRKMAERSHPLYIMNDEGKTINVYR